MMNFGVLFILFGTSITIIDVSSHEQKIHRTKKRRSIMKHTNSRFVVARLMLIVLTLAITVFSFASCDSLPPELQGLLGGNPNASCEHTNVENCVCKDCNEQKHTNLVLVPGVAPTCENKGYIDCYQCFGCGKVFLDADAKGEVDNNYTEIVIQPLGHNYVNNVCDRCGDCKHLTVENCVCKDCDKAVHLGILVDYAYIAPTCTENGRIAYLACGDCETILYDAETLAPITDPSEIIIPSLGGEHNYVDGVCDRCGDVDENVPACDHTTVENCVCKDCGTSVHTGIECIPAMAPSCGDTGFRCDVYVCSDCDKGFYDAEAKKEITDVSSVVIPPLGHIRVGGVCERCGAISGGVGDDGNIDNPTPFQLACSQLGSLYRPDNKKATPSDYELVSKIVIEGEVFAVTWTIANESITLTYDADKDVYIVDVPDEVSKNCYYTIEAAMLNNSNGRTYKYQFIRLLEATATDDGDGDSSVCQHKNAEYVQATPEMPCNDFVVLFDIYVCCDCLDIFYDSECKNEVPYDTSVTVIPTGHKYVGDVCEKCGFYHGEGAFPGRPSEPTAFESAYFYLIDLYSANHKEATTTDYELISKVVIESEEFAVTWNVANESITITYDADNDVYVVDIPDEVSEKCYYSITATISDGEGNTKSFMFVRVLVPAEE